MKQVLNNKAEKILELETRKNIFQIVRENEGCHFREIERRSGVAHGTLKYHLGFLVKHELLREEKDKNNVRYFSGEVGREDSQILGMLRQKSVRRILLLILSEKKCSHGDIADFVKLSGATVSWHLNKMIEKGVIEKKSSGKEARYFLRGGGEEIARVMITYRESFFDSLVDRVVEMWEVR